MTGASPLLADLDRPEGAVYVAIYLGEIERGAVAVVNVAETKEMETDKIQFVKASEYDIAADRLTSEGIGASQPVDTNDTTREGRRTAAP